MPRLKLPFKGILRKKSDSDIERSMRQHPLLLSRHLMTTQETIDFIPKFDSNPIDRLKLIIQDLGCSVELRETLKSVCINNDSQQGTLSRKSQMTKQTEISDSKSNPLLDYPSSLNSTQKNLAAMADVKVVVPLRDDSFQLSKGPAAQLRSQKDTLTLSPLSSEIALNGLEAHKFLSAEGYVTFRPASPIEESLAEAISRESLERKQNDMEPMPVESENLNPALNEASELQFGKKTRNITIESSIAETNHEKLREALASTSQENLDSKSILDALVSTRFSQTYLQDLIQRAIAFHEANKLELAFQIYAISALSNFPIGLFLTGLSLRHGWGCDVDQGLAISCLEYSCNCSNKILRKIRAKSTQAVRIHHADLLTHQNIPPKPFFNVLSESDLNTNFDESFVAVETLSPIEQMQALVAREELSMSLYEIGQCYRFGWGTEKSKATAIFYFRTSADLGNVEAQMDLARCFDKGYGVKPDRFMSAAYFRMANLQGKSEYGLAWIYKPKYDEFFEKNFPKYAAVEQKKQGAKANGKSTKEQVSEHMGMVRKFTANSRIMTEV